MNTSSPHESNLKVRRSGLKYPLRGTSIVHPPSSLLVLLLLLAATSSAVATVYYVNVNNVKPTPPYTNWATAATNIQEAVDAAGTGDEVVVTNGIYTGGSAVDPYGGANCVVVDKPLSLSSVNGPGVTVIDGGGAGRCLYLANNAVMAGFTLTNGLTEWGGGVYCESTNAVLSNCVLTGNSSDEEGGGASGGTLNNCTLTGNSAFYGGGAVDSTLNNCALMANFVRGYFDALGRYVGGVGGGAYSDGYQPCALNNCTLTGNSAYAGEGGGAYSCTLNNCIVYFNSGPNRGNYDSSSVLNYCCTTPMPTNGVGNISVDPQLASASHLSGLSPCIGAGSAIYSSGTDIDGEALANPPSIGCDEYHAGAVTGPLTVDLTVTFTNVATEFAVSLMAFIAGQTDLSVWDFGDGLVQVNAPYTSHTWTAPGDYLVTLWAFNGSYPEGVNATVTIHVEKGVRYVAATSGNSVAPYTSWATAATNLQDAVEVAPPGPTVFVSDGTYASGGRATPATGDGVTNRVAVIKPLTVCSVNGPGLTVIQGLPPGATNGDIRCVYLTNGAILVGFTLTNGKADYPGGGGGVFCESSSAVLSNCVLSGNWAGPNTAGGGASGGTLNKCTLTANSAYAGEGGGAVDSTLNDCTLIGNKATMGGGVSGGTLNNCMLTGSSAADNGGGATWSMLNNCMLIGNSAVEGGGAAWSTLNNCMLTGNLARGYSISGSYYRGAGGGAYVGTLNNCTVTGNSASDDGGGAFECILNNCVVYFNTATNDPNYCQDQYGGVLNYCCTTPMPTNGIGNFTNAPLFVAYAGGNLRLQSNSPCINSGNNAYVFGSTDLDGNPRIVGCTVDLGAYEYQSPLSMISYAWLQQYGLPISTNTDLAELDGTGLTVYQDWVAGSNPTNALSVLKMLALSATNTPLGLVVTWQSVNTRTYYLQRSTNLAAQPAFITIQSNLVGQAGTTSYTDTTATNTGPYFYRVGVGN